MNESAPGEFRDGARHLNAGRTATDDNGRHQPCATCRIVWLFGLFARKSLFTDFLGVRCPLEPRREGSAQVS